MQLFRADALTALQRPGAKRVSDEHYNQVDTTWNKAGTYTAPSSTGVIPPTVRLQRSNIFDKHHDLPYPTPETYPQLSSLTYNEKDAEPNLVPPKMTPQSSVLDRKMFVKSDSSQRGDDDATIKSISISIKDDQSRRPGIIKKDSFEQKAFDTISVMTDTRTEKTEVTKADRESIYTAKSGRSKVLPKDPDTIKFEEANSELSTSPKKVKVDNKVLVLDAMKKLELKKQERDAKKKEVRLTAELTESEYLQPKVNSSKGVYDQLIELQREIDNDMISVTTIDTCSTDRREAAKLVDMAMDERRYRELKPFVDPSYLPKPRMKKLPPQIDPNRKKRQEDTAPTKEDLEKLYKPDPLVQLRLKFNKENSSSSSSSSNSSNKKKEKDELKLDFNSSTLLPEFSININSDDIFGPIDAAKSWELIEKDIANARDINYCNRRTLF